MAKVKKPTIAALTTVSAAIVAYELTQIRIFAFALNPVIAHAAIGMAVLGFGLGATLIAVRSSRNKGDLMPRIARLSLGLAAAIVLVNGHFARTSVHTTIVESGGLHPVGASISLLPCILPYFFAGMITTLILQSGISRIGRLYFWNLFGSALGCVGMILLIRPLGAERLLLATAALSAAAGLVLVFNRRGALRWMAAAIAAIALAWWPTAPKIFPFQKDINSLSSNFERWEMLLGVPPPLCELNEWDPAGRIEVLRVAEKNDYRLITVDGRKMRLMLEDIGKPGWGRPLFADSMYGAAYHLKKRPNVLVIGAGGGADIQTALHWKAESVTGVEVSGSVLKAVTGTYDDFAGWPNRNNVEVFHGDGRFFAKNTKHRFDVIQMSGVDATIMPSTSRGMNTTENHLYTVEAFTDLLGLLEPGGIVSVMRFGDQPSRLSSIAAQALLELGIPGPGRCIVALRQTNLAGILVKLEPFSDEEIATLREFASREKKSCLSIPHYDFAGVQLSAPVEMIYPASSSAPKIQPPTDDRPFYALSEMIGSARNGGSSRPALGLLTATTCGLGAIALALIFLPALSIQRRTKTGPRHLLGVGAYFIGIGAGFVLLEVGVIHRASAFVGTPGAVVAVVISAILVSAAVGARVADFVSWPMHKRALFALAGLLALSAAHKLGAGPLFDLLFGLPLWARCIVAALTIAPSGFFVGWFFPLGLRAAKSFGNALVPWAIAVNGLASVIGSLSTWLLLVLLGFSGVFLIALLLYTVAAASLFGLRRQIKDNLG